MSADLSIFRLHLLAFSSIIYVYKFRESRNVIPGPGATGKECRLARLFFYPFSPAGVSPGPSWLSGLFIHLAGMVTNRLNLSSCVKKEVVTIL